MLAQRLLSALVGIPLLIALVGWGPAWLFTGVVLLFAMGAQLELAAALFENVNDGRDCAAVEVQLQAGTKPFRRFGQEDPARRGRQSA